MSASPDRLRASADPLRELIGEDWRVFRTLNDFPFTQAEVDDIHSKTFQPGDSESAVRCALGVPTRQGKDSNGRTVLVYGDFAAITMNEGRVFAISYLPGARGE
jgi:hypothetical protein